MNVSRVRVLRESDLTGKVVVVAQGVRLPSGRVVVEWERDAFPQGERTDGPTQSHYADLQDAEQATGGVVEVAAEDEPASALFRPAGEVA